MVNLSREERLGMNGYSKVTVYSRHANREDLIRAVLQQQADQLAESFTIEPVNRENVRTALIEFGLSLLEFLFSKDNLQFMHALCSHDALPAESLHHIYQGGPEVLHQRLSQWLASSHQTRLLHCTTPQYSAELLIGMLMGLDQIRAMYRHPPMRSADDQLNHVSLVVDAFLVLHRLQPVE